MRLGKADPLLVETVTRLLSDIATDALDVAVEGGAWPAAEWQKIEEMGLPFAWLPTDLGGAGLSRQDGFTIARLVGYFAVPLPIAEVLIASAIARVAKIRLPESCVILVSPTASEEGFTLDADNKVSGICRAPSFLNHADYLLLPIETSGAVDMALVANQGKLEQRTGEQDTQENTENIRQAHCRDVPRRLVLKEAPLVSRSSGQGQDIRQSIANIGAAVRAQQIAGAGEAILDMCLAYVTVRKQFGRRLSQFQAIQHHLAAMTGEVARMTCSADAAALSLMKDGFESHRLNFAVAAAKICAGASGANVTRIAHQVHGAIGFSREYALHRFTRRIRAWRDECGNEKIWARQLGQLVVENGAEQIWPLICEPNDRAPRASAGSSASS